MSQQEMPATWSVAGGTSGNGERQKDGCDEATWSLAEVAQNQNQIQ